MFRFTAIAIASLSITAGAHAESAPYLLKYDQVTGSLTIDTQGGPLFLFNITVDTSYPGFSGFNTANYTPPPSLAPGSVLTPGQISGGNVNVFTGWASLEHNFGNILPAGYNEEEIAEIILQQDYIPAPGQGAGDFVLQVVQSGPPIPEPSSLLLITAGTALIARRRRSA